MKLNIVPASQGTLWVRLGVQTFFKQPLALVSLFLLVQLSLALLSLLPVVGTVLAFGLVPAITLGFMEATRAAANGQRPSPTHLLVAFRGEQATRIAILKLGAMYAGSVLAIILVSTPFDGGKFAQLLLIGGQFNTELVQTPGFMLALLMVAALLCLQSMFFWHSAPLVGWDGVAPLKSLFFSWMACKRNLWAMALYSIVWFLAQLLAIMLAATVAAVLGMEAAVLPIMLTSQLLLFTMIFSSTYFTYRDSFDHPTGADT